MSEWVIWNSVHAICSLTSTQRGKEACEKVVATATSWPQLSPSKSCVFKVLFFFFALAGHNPNTPECTLREEDISEKPFINVGPTTPGSSLKSCSPPQQQSGPDELHIINIPESVGAWWETFPRSPLFVILLPPFVKFLLSLFLPRSNISLQVEGQTTRVFLRGPQGTTWNFLNPVNAQFMVSMCQSKKTKQNKKKVHLVRSEGRHSKCVLRQRFKDIFKTIQIQNKLANLLNVFFFFYLVWKQK